MRAAGRHEEKRRPDGRVHLFHQRRHLFDARVVVARDRRVDLQADAGVARERGRADGAVERALHAAERVVHLRVGPVDAQRDAFAADAARRSSVALVTRPVPLGETATLRSRLAA